MSTSKCCPMWGSAFIIASSDGDKTYMVKFFVGQKPVCTCPAYRYSGHYDDQTCKHIEIVKKYGCFWYTAFNGPLPELNDSLNKKHTMGLNDLDRAKVALFSTTKKGITDEACPGCGQPMIEEYV